jgi:rhamnulokinase
MEISEPITSDAARDANFTNEGGVDGKIRFLANVTGLWLLEELRRAWAANGEDVDYWTIMTEAEKAPPYRSIVNPDDPSFIAPNDMRIAIRDFCRRTGQTVPNGVGPFSRCVFESLALAYRRRIRQLEKITGRKIERIHIVGGGARNELLCKMTAEACGIPVIAGPQEAALAGNIMIQAIAQNLIGSIEEGRRIMGGSINPVEYPPTQTESWDYAADKLDSLSGDGR